MVSQAEVPDPKWICPDRSRRKVPMSRPSQTQSAYVQTVPDGKWICPNFRAFKIFRAFFVRSKTNMSRPSQTETVYVQTFMRSCPDHRALLLRAFEDKYVQTIPDRNSICPDFRASMSRPSCGYVQTTLRSNPDHRAFMSRLSCVHQTEKKLHLGVQCYSLKMKTERVPKFHKSICLRFIKKFDFKSLFL